MTKQEIYVEMLSRALPHIRNIQTQNLFAKGTDRSCYYEAELLHNIVGSLLEKDFTEQDIWFLNCQAKYFLEHAMRVSPNYQSHKKHILMLFELVPEQLRSKLTWHPN